MASNERPCEELRRLLGAQADRADQRDAREEIAPWRRRCARSAPRAGARRGARRAAGGAARRECRRRRVGGGAGMPPSVAEHVARGRAAACRAGRSASSSAWRSSISSCGMSASVSCEQRRRLLHVEIGGAAGLEAHRGDARGCRAGRARCSRASASCSSSTRMLHVGRGDLARPGSPARRRSSATEASSSASAASMPRRNLPPEVDLPRRVEAGLVGVEVARSTGATGCSGWRACACTTPLSCLRLRKEPADRDAAPRLRLDDAQAGRLQRQVLRVGELDQRPSTGSSNTSHPALRRRDVRMHCGIAAGDPRRLRRNDGRSIVGTHHAAAARREDQKQDQPSRCDADQDGRHEKTETSGIRDWPT